MPATMIKVCSAKGCASVVKARGMCASHYNRWHYAQDPERHRDRSRKWYRANPEKAADARGRRDPAQLRRAARAYYRANRLRAVAAAANAKARRLGVIGIVTAEGLQARIDYFGGRCWVCGTTGADTVDHVIALGAGGPNVHSNIRPACLTCNTAKSWEGRR